MILSSVILVWGYKKLAAVMQSDQHLFDLVMIIWQIIAYFFIVIENIIGAFFKGILKMYQKTSCCQLTFNMTCIFILTLIVSKI